MRIAEELPEEGGRMFSGKRSGSPVPSLTQTHPPSLKGSRPHPAGCFAQVGWGTEGAWPSSPSGQPARRGDESREAGCGRGGGRRGRPRASPSMRPRDASVSLYFGVRERSP